MACSKHQKNVTRLLTDAGSCPWCEIDSLREQLKDAMEEYKAMVSEYRGRVLELENEISRAEQFIMDGS